MSNDNKTPKNEVAEAVAKALSESLPLAVLAAVKAMRDAEKEEKNEDLMLEMAARKGKGVQCPTCNQPDMRCKDKHVEMVVFPAGEYIEHFDGLKLNGVVYNSGPERRLIPVPASNSFSHDLWKFDINERELRMGKKRNRHSGTLSPNGSHVSQAGIADFFR